MSGLILAAFAAGFLAFFTPCILPVAAGMICIVSGVSFKELSDGKTPRRRAALTTVFFVFGFAFCFSLLGGASGALGKFLGAHMRAFHIISGVLLIFLGLFLADFFKLPFFLSRTKRFEIKWREGYLTAFFAGLAFAFAWTPCLGPVLASLLILAGEQATALKGTFLLFVFSLGLGLPFILCSFFGGHFLGFMKSARGAAKIIQRALALLIILIGLIFIWDAQILNNIFL